jgi:hypothetical protein
MLTGSISRGLKHVEIVDLFFHSNASNLRFFRAGSEQGRALRAVGLTVSLFATALACTQNADAQSGYGPIKAGHSDKCMTIPNGSMDDSYPLVQSTCDGSLKQAFTVIPTGNGSYYLATAHSQKCVDVPGASQADNQQINQYECDGSPEQMFALNLIGNDYYQIVASHSGKCVGVNGASYADGVGIIQSQCSGQQDQMFWISSMVARDPNTQAAILQQQQQAFQQQQAAQQQAQQQQPVYQQPAVQQAQPQVSQAQQQRIQELEEQVARLKTLDVTEGGFNLEEVQKRNPGMREMEYPPPPYVALSIDFVVVKKVSSGMDGATSALFGALDGLVSKGASAAGGIGGSVTVMAMRSQGLSFGDISDSSVFSGDDDLLIMLDNIAQWPQAYTNAYSISVSSGQTVPIQISWNVPTNVQHHIDLYERDLASDNDRLGYIIFPAGTLYPGTRTEYVLHNSSEGSLYTVMVEVSQRLPDEPSGWVPASLYTNQKAYCFSEFGCN